MDEFVDRTELLRRLQAAYSRFRAAIAPLSAQQMETPGVVGDWSIRDVIAHFIAHEQFALREIQHALRGERYHADDGETTAMNARAVTERRSQAPEDLLRDWDVSYHQVLAAVQALPEAAFEPAGQVVRLLDDTIDGALANNSYEHYAEHLPAVEAWVRQRS